MNPMNWKRTEVGSFPLFIESDTTVTVTVLSPAGLQMVTLDGEELPPQAAMIELEINPSDAPLWITLHDAVRLSTLLVDALPIAERFDLQAVHHG